MLDVPEQVFEAVYTQVFSPKTGVVTKDGLEMRDSNLVLVLLAFASEPIENYLRNIHSASLQMQPTLLKGILNENCIHGYQERHIRWSYNKSFLHFYNTVQRLCEKANPWLVCSIKHIIHEQVHVLQIPHHSQEHVLASVVNHGS